MSLAPERECLARLNFGAYSSGQEGAVHYFVLLNKMVRFPVLSVWRGAKTQCVLCLVLTFLQVLVDRHLALNTIKTYAVAITSCQRGF